MDFFSQLQVQGKLSTYKKSSTLIFLLIKIKPKNSQIVFFFLDFMIKDNISTENLKQAVNKCNLTIIKKWTPRKLVSK